jgi:hypothetical protein
MSLQKSSNPKKKYTVKVTYNNQTKTIHFGSEGYKDYPTYYKELGKEDADKKKNAYIARHSKNGENFNNPLTPAFWAVNINWAEPTVAGSLRKLLSKYPTLKLEKITE